MFNKGGFQCKYTLIISIPLCNRSSKAQRPSRRIKLHCEAIEGVTGNLVYIQDLQAKMPTLPLDRKVRFFHQNTVN